MIVILQLKKVLKLKLKTKIGLSPKSLIFQREEFNELIREIGRIILI